MAYETVAYCQRCPATWEGQEADRLARLHTEKQGHPTAVETRQKKIGGGGSHGTPSGVTS